MYVDSETICRIISEINFGMSLSDVEKKHGITRSDIKKAIRNYVGTNKEYRKIITPLEEKNMDDEILISETGVLTKIEDVFSEEQIIYAPKFCLGEIEKLYSKMPDMIEKIKSDKRIVWMEEPYCQIKIPKRLKPFKRRTTGIVRLACDLAHHAKKITVVTTSIEVQELIFFQKEEKLTVIKY